MIIANKNITINSDKYKIWEFLSDLSLGLSFNRFHKEINLNKSFSIHSNQEIIIKHNFGFGSIDMNLRVLDSIKFERLMIQEYSDKNKDKVFMHKSTFEITDNIQSCILNYSVSGSFNNKVADISFTPVLNAVMIEELSKIKSAIESSENISNLSKQKQYNPI